MGLRGFSPSLAIDDLDHALLVLSSFLVNGFRPAINCGGIGFFFFLPWALAVPMSLPCRLGRNAATPSALPVAGSMEPARINAGILRTTRIQRIFMEYPIMKPVCFCTSGTLFLHLPTPNYRPRLATLPCAIALPVTPGYPDRLRRLNLDHRRYPTREPRWTSNRR